MRCPKCHYLSFEPEARCRNCGYDLALAEDDLIIKAVDDEEGPLQDFDLRDEGHERAPAPMTLGPLHLEPEPAAPESVAVALAPPPPPAPGPRPVRPPSTTTELPLFMRTSALVEVDPEAPLVQMPPAPRPPLSVRRRPVETTLETGRGERTSMVDVAANLESVWAPLPPTVAPMDVEEPAHMAPPPDNVSALRRKIADRDRVIEAPDSEPDFDRHDAVDHDDLSDAAARARAMAAGIDLALLAGIDVVVVWLTVKVCALTFGDVLTLPLLPMAAFLLLLTIGYLVLFTATSGQTLGKMAAHIRVVPEGDDRSDDALSLPQAALRSLATLPSVIVLGAGFLPALGATGLAVHDRIAHTRVVRA